MNNLTILAPTKQGQTDLNQAIQACIEATPSTVFSADVLAFINALSKQLLQDVSAKQHAELVALGFWLRTSHMQALKNQQPAGLSKALGLVLHFTPANVDSMFVYSWVCSLLMGNNNIVRVASAESAAKNVLLNTLNVLFEQTEFRKLAKRNLFVSYPRESSLSAKLSLHADARVIWGGDASVNAIRALPIKPRCRDISFADRYSAALINGDDLKDEQQVAQLASLLWRDTQPHQQQACSSPRVIFWLGDTQLQHSLFTQINQLAGQQGSEINQLNNHLAVSQVMQSSGVVGKPLIQQTICVLPISELRAEFLDWHMGTGLFLLMPLSKLDDLADNIDNKLQTLSYWGMEQEQLLKLVAQPSIKGIDRIVKVGHALTFSPDWDGYHVLDELSRHIFVG